MPAIIKTESSVDNIKIDGVLFETHEFGIKVNYAPSQIKTIELIEKLKQSGVEIQDLTIKDANLDEVFSYIINR